MAKAISKVIVQEERFGSILDEGMNSRRSERVEVGAAQRIGMHSGPTAGEQMPRKKVRAKKQVGLSEETDADLLVYMTMKAEEPDLARGAWGEFYERHIRYLYGVCFRSFKSLLGGEAGVVDLVTETFRRAYEFAHTFDPGMITNDERLRLRVRAWLGRIAHRLAQSALRDRRRLPTRMMDPSDLSQMTYSDPIDRSCDPTMVGQVQEALNTLSEREQLVIRVTLQYYDAGEKHQRLPNDVASELAETLGTTPENLRQIRKRAYGKLHTILSKDKEQGRMNK